jgi:hypothetical protein
VPEEKQKAFKDIEEKLLPLFNERIKLINDMADSIRKTYIESNRLHPFRELCLGYLLIARNNSLATLRLLENNLVDQINYISRNTFEMVVTLYYIDNDESERKNLTDRYFEFSAVEAHEVMKLMEDYPLLNDGTWTPERDKKVKEAYDEFIKKYSKGNKKPNTKLWSGKNMREMIESLKKVDVKKDLLYLYRLVVNMNNSFLHPTPISMRQTMKAHYNDEVHYVIRVMHLSSISASVDRIMQKFLEQFPKGRPGFRERLNDINKKNAVVSEEAKSKGIL